jgi:hypothetical protein
MGGNDRLPERGYEKNQGKSKQALHHIHIQNTPLLSVNG